jgi:hypothetical protein
MSLILSTKNKIINPYDQPSFEHTQKYGIDWSGCCIDLNKLLAYWPLNDGAGPNAQELVNSLDLGIWSGAHWANSEFWNCLEFDGSNDSASCPATGLLNFYNKTFTISMWIQCLDTGNFSGKWFMAGGGGYIKEHGSYNSLGGYFYDGSDLPSWAGWLYTNDFSLDVWRHTVWVIALSASGWSVKIYSDGLYETSDSGAEVLDFSGNWYFMLAMTNNRQANMRAANVAIFERGLDNREIFQLYRNPWCLIRQSYPRVFGGLAPSGGTNYTEVVDESMGVTDTDSRVHTAVRSVAESMGLTDTTIKDLSKVISESMGITDAEARACVVIRVVAESMGIMDTASRICEVYRTIAESLGITDSMTRAAVVERAVAESLGITDSVTDLKELLETINESVGLTDSIAKDEVMVLSSSLGITDSITRICIVLRTIAESVGLTDVDSRVWEIVRTVAESMGLTDVVTPVEGGAGDVYETINDSLGVSDTTSRVHLALRILSESLGLTDAIVRVFNINRIISDSMGLTDGTALDRLLSVADNLGITDDVNRLIDYVRTQDDDVGLIDSMVRVATAARTINEALGLTDSVSEQLGGLVKAAWAFIVMRQTNN